MTHITHGQAARNGTGEAACGFASVFATWLGLLGGSGGLDGGSGELPDALSLAGMVGISRRPVNRPTESYFTQALTAKPAHSRKAWWRLEFRTELEAAIEAKDVHLACAHRTATHTESC